MHLLASLVARGYRPPEPPPTAVRYVLPKASSSQASPRLEVELGRIVEELRGDGAGDGDRERVAVSLPTYLGRTGEAEHRAIVAHVAEQAAELAGEERLEVLVIVGLQHGGGEAEAAESRLVAMLEAARESHPAILAVGLLVPGRGKLLTVNAAAELARRAGAASLVLLDDDVRMEPGCLFALHGALRRAGFGKAVGAVKEAEAGEHWSGRLLRWIGARLEPARAYPHACCMIVDLEVLRGGIPWRYVDDGYLFFELVEPDRPDPLHRLLLEPAARCRHVVGGEDAGSTLARQRRMLIMHHVFMADYRRKARYYRRHMLFYGLWPIGARAAGEGAAASAVRWLLKLVYFSMFTAVGAELALRGLLARPLEGSGWGSAPLARPEDPPGTSSEDAPASEDIPQSPSPAAHAAGPLPKEV